MRDAILGSRASSGEFYARGGRLDRLGRPMTAPAAARRARLRRDVRAARPTAGSPGPRRSLRRAARLARVVERSSAAGVAAALRSQSRAARAGRALRRPHNWVQLAKFCAVGASGYVVNLAVYTLLLKARRRPLPARGDGSFLVAVTNNYTWNRLWTFRGQRGHVAYQGMRFFVVALLALIANLVVLEVLIRLGLPEVAAQAIAIVLVTPLNFVGNKLWSFRRTLTRVSCRYGSRRSRFAARRPRAATTPTAPVFDGRRAPRPDAVRPRPEPARADRGARAADLPRATRRSRTGSTATPSKAASPSLPTTRSLARGRSMSGGRRPARSRRERSTTPPAG